MKVILLQDVHNLGNTGDNVNVPDGYARNYLIPKKLALEATALSLLTLQKQKAQQNAKLTREAKDAQKLAQQINQISCTIVRKVGENDRLYGSVTAIDIAEVLKEEGLNIDKRRIELDEPIKSLGIYNVPVKVHPEITATLKVWVIKT